MGSKGAPGYQKTTVGTGGLFGKSTNSKNGTKFVAEDWQTDMGGLGSNLINTSLGGLSSNDYLNDPNFQVYQDNLNKMAMRNYDNSVLSQLANRGLMRSSGLQSATKSFGETLADDTVNLMDNYYNRQLSNLNAGLNSQNALYNWITGLNNASLQTSQAVNDHAMKAYQAEQAANNAMWGNIMNAVGTIGAGAMTGGASLAGNAKIADAIKGTKGV
jgi:hypothetical protein